MGPFLLFVCLLLKRVSLQIGFLCLTLTCTQTGRWFSDTSTQDDSQLTTDHPLKQQYLRRNRKSESPTVFVDFIQPTHFFLAKSSIMPTRYLKGIL